LRDLAEVSALQNLHFYLPCWIYPEPGCLEKSGVYFFSSYPKKWKVYPFEVKWLTHHAKLTECFTVACFSQANDSDNFPGGFIGVSSKFQLDVPRYIVYKIKRYKTW